MAITYLVGVQIHEDVYSNAMNEGLSSEEQARAMGNSYARPSKAQHLSYTPDMLSVQEEEHFVVCFDRKERAAFIASHARSGIADIDDKALSPAAFAHSLDALSALLQREIPGDAMARSPCVVHVTSEQSDCKNEKGRLHLKGLVEAGAYVKAAARHVPPLKVGDPEDLRRRNASAMRHHVALAHSNTLSNSSGQALLARLKEEPLAPLGVAGFTWMGSREAPVLLAVPDDPGRPLNSLTSEQVLPQLLAIQAYLRQRELLIPGKYMCYFAVPCFHPVPGAAPAAATQSAPGESQPPMPPLTRTLDRPTEDQASPSEASPGGAAPTSPSEAPSQGQQQEEPAAPPPQRKPLKLLPKSLSPAAASGVSAALPSSKPSPFGGARPVDTAARDREIEAGRKAEALSSATSGWDAGRKARPEGGPEALGGTGRGRSE